MKRILATFLALCVSPLLLSYVIYFKDGNTVMAKAKYTVENGKAIVTLMNGSVVAYDLKVIDVPRTDKANKAGLDTDGVLTAVGSGAVQTETPQRQSLGSIAKGAGALTAPKGQTSGNGKVASTSTSSRKDKESEFSDESVRRAFGKIFENVNLFEYKIVEGTTPDTVRILMTTDNEKDIFNALTASAKVVAELNDLGKKNVANLELYLSTTSGAAAGRFSISVDRAKTLAEGKVPVEQFFVDQVLF
jgi:hypothetical protein